LQLTLSAIDEMLTTVGEVSLEHMPQMENVRKSLLRKALDLQEVLLKSQPSNPVLQMEVARAHHRMGDIYVLLGEHDPAKSAYLEAIQLYQGLEARQVDDLHLQHRLAISLTSCGELVQKTEPEPATRQFRQSLEIQTKLCELEPENDDFRRELSRTFNNYGLLLADTGRYVEAEAIMRSAIEQLEPLAGGVDASQAAISDLGRSQINLGFLLRRQAPRAREAELAFLEAIKNLRLLVDRDPANRDYRYRLAVALLDLSHQLKDLPGRAEDAIARAGEANAKLVKLHEEFPDIPLYGYELANSHNSLGNALLLVDDRAGVKDQLSRADRVLEELRERFPVYSQSVADYQSLRGIVLGGLGACAFQLDEMPDLPAAESFVTRAIGHQEAAVAINPANAIYDQRLEAHRGFLRLIRDKQAAELQAAKK
jgi:tetratricopeptide (TPR) repeat protein